MMQQSERIEIDRCDGWHTCLHEGDFSKLSKLSEDMALMSQSMVALQETSKATLESLTGKDGLIVESRVQGETMKIYKRLTWVSLSVIIAATGRYLLT